MVRNEMNLVFCDFVLTDIDGEIFNQFFEQICKQLIANHKICNWFILGLCMICKFDSWFPPSLLLLLLTNLNTIKLRL